MLHAAHKFRLDGGSAVEGRMKSQCLTVLLLAFLLTSGEANVTLNPQNKTQPSESLQGLLTFAILLCGINADFQLNGTAVESRWITNTGEEILVGTTEKYLLSQGSSVTDDLDSLLVVQNLTYSNAGTYICRARDTRDPSNRGPWVEGQIHLQLVVELTAAETEVSTFDNATQVSLSCEMSLYLRPDEDLQWFRGGQLIASGSGRHSVTYTDGTAEQGQFGGDVLGSSRVSTLVISQPQTSDAGNYSCAIRNTQQSQDIQLAVEKSSLPNPSTVQPTSTSSETGGRTSSMTSSSPPAGTMSPASDNPIPLPIIIGAIAAVLGIIVVVLIVIIIVVSFRRRSHTATITGNGDMYSALNGGGYPGANKMSVSPTPHDPPSRANFEPDVEMGYDRPHHGNMKDKRSPPPTTPAPDYECLDSTGIKYDPYYDNPEDLKPSIAPAVPTNPPPKKSKAGSAYDEVDPFPMNLNSKTSTLDMRSVPSPAVILSGSLHRQIEQKNPDFAYPSYQDGFDLSGEPDYDQIYSEPLDPTMLRSNLAEGLMTPEEAVPYSAIYDDPANPFSDTDVPAPFKITKSSIIEIRKLGTGQFGQVILAKTKGVSLRDMSLSETDGDTSRSILVAIKKLKQDAESGLMKAFDKEVKFMSRLKHDNVVRLLGVCTGTESFIMMEYMENGDLNQFLQKQALMSDSISGLQEHQVTPIILLYMGVQIASGMHYLASRRFVHRDLATRNCLVGKDFIVKISDFGMSRSLYESAYYRVQGTLVLPIRWMACETFYGKFSVKSDSWAFGVALWEIYTLGKVDPYEDMTDEEVIADAIRGPDRKILPRPSTCPQELYEIMHRCWVNEPSMRADFGEIYSRLFMIYTRQAL